MIAGNQEKTLSTMNFPQSAHGDQNVQEERLPRPQNIDDIVQISCSGQSDVAGSYLYGSVAKEISEAFACAEKFRSYLSSFYRTFSSSHNTSIPLSSPSGDNLLDPLVALRKPSLVVPDQPNDLSITQDVTDLEIDYFDDDVQKMDNDKNLHESSAEYRRDHGGQGGDGDSTACRKASEYMPLLIIDSDDDEDIVMYKCSYRIGGGDSVTCGNAPDHVPVVIIDPDGDEDKVICECSDQIGGDDSVTCANASLCEPGVIIDSSKDKDMITTIGVSTTEDQACNIKEHLGCIKQNSVDVVLSEASIFPSDARDYCSQDRCDEFENGNPDYNITIPPVQISNIEEDTCVDNEQVITRSSCASPIRVYGRLELKKSGNCWNGESNMEEDEAHDGGSEMEWELSTKIGLDENTRVKSSGSMEEDETHDGGSETESELNTKIGIDENTRVKSYGSMGTECLSLENNNLDGLEKDGLNDIWREMAMAIEYSKLLCSSHHDEGESLGTFGSCGTKVGTAVADSSLVQQCSVHDCEHSSILLDDMGCVCRICGLIQKSIDTIFDYQWTKGTRTTRTYTSEYRTTKHANSTEINVQFEQNLFSGKVTVHPRHMKKMKPHQLEGFNFLVRNLVTDKPGGCILAHAPGSGKTFMIISFIQSFLAKYPYARPLVVLPKGIIPTWKKEFRRWQVEDIPLYDFYTSKSGNRHQQLDVLKSWIEQKSILFLGYKQLSNIIYDSANTKIAAACQEMLLKGPGLLILDEGHTPRNENTDVFQSLRRVQTPRKVVLSGTLFQNHVSEVFNILDLVHPKFLELDSSRAIIRRVMSRLPISRSRRHSRTNYTPFYDSVEEMLRSGDDLKRKVTVIHDLREMTNGILHYYKGDFLDELPGLVDFTVLLNLSSKQKVTIQTLKKLEKFKRISVENAIYVHPRLKEISENIMGKGGDIFDEDKIHRLLDKMDLQDGVKTKFVLNILDLCESFGEKLLVFSMYLLPLKFLERLLVKEKGWSPGKEIFLISGDSSPEQREWSMETFNHSPDSKVLFGSIKACGEGISLVGASRVVILDVHLNPSVTRQAIGRAFRPGQLKKVFTYRLVAADSLEEEDHYVSLKKELVSKMWFEWNEFCNHRDYEMDAIDLKNCEDIFLESPVLGQDVKVLYRR